MTIASHELALCLINENSGSFIYSERVRLANGQRKTRYGACISWSAMLSNYARHYEREHGDGSEIFTTEDVLFAAAEIAEYYTTHVAEIKAVG